jgi:protein TonB
MKQKVLAVLLTLGFATFAYSPHAMDQQLRMLGLAMHQETGRNIFLGALHSDDPAARISTLLEGDGVGVMEHRVVARRTSIRSLLGKLLLQGEVATGRSPDLTTIQFADDIMSMVNGSLYAGDALAIALTPEGATTATLNGILLAASEHNEVFFYFLSAWVGEKGPSTAFRSAILSPRIDTGLLTLYTANETSADRQRQVAAWIEQTNTSPDVTGTQFAVANVAMGRQNIKAVAMPELTATRLAPPVIPAISSAAAAGNPATAKAATKTPALNKVAGASSSASSDPAVTADTDDSTNKTGAGDENIQLAMAAPPMSGTEQASDIQAVDVIEYSERLGLFNNDIIRRVYAQIRYPRAAVRRSLQGELELDVTLDRSGALVTVEIAQSSGYSMLDKSAVSAANKALSGIRLDNMDPVAIAEYGSGDNLLVVPVPVSFILTE